MLRLFLLQTQRALANGGIRVLSSIRPLSYLSKEEVKYNRCGEHLTDCRKEAWARLPRAEQRPGHIGPKGSCRHVKHVREFQTEKSPALFLSG